MRRSRGFFKKFFVSSFLLLLDLSLRFGICAPHLLCDLQSPVTPFYVQKHNYSSFRLFSMAEKDLVCPNTHVKCRILNSPGCPPASGCILHYASQHVFLVNLVLCTAEDKSHRLSCQEQSSYKVFVLCQYPIWTSCPISTVHMSRSGPNAWLMSYSNPNCSCSETDTFFIQISCCRLKSVHEREVKVQDTMLSNCIHTPCNDMYFV